MLKMKAFTLIELLIVVAIIAILAAIAVPNFLEAQTRARVSRTENDLRSIALAMESYYVDNGSYLPSQGHSPLPTSSTLSHADKRLLTTPISYITTVPPDIFRPGAGSAGSSQYLVYALGYTSSGGKSYATYPHTSWMTWSYGPDLRSNTGGYMALWEVLENEARDMPNIGKDEDGNYIAGTTGNGQGMRYDPTNGTISWGEIYRFEGAAKRTTR